MRRQSRKASAPIFSRYGNFSRNVLPHNYRTKVSRYNEFYHGIARRMNVQAAMLVRLMQRYLPGTAFIGTRYDVCMTVRAFCKFTHIALLARRVSQF